jgi:hypothetical protein
LVVGTLGKEVGMFVQVIQGGVKDAAGLESRWRKWIQEVKPGAVGYLGSTAGITSDGEFVAVVRFESREAAQKNSDRPEQSQWWNETEGHLQDPAFQDCEKVELWLGGGSDDAGFVQVIQSPETAPEEMSEEDERKMAEIRPDVIGGLTAVHGDGSGQTSVAYFTSEQEARAGEAKPEFEEQERQSGFDPSRSRFFDLTEPWLDSP